MSVMTTERNEIRNFISIHLPDEKYMHQESELFEFNNSDEIIGPSKTFGNILKYSDQLFITPEIIHSLDNEEVVNMFKQMQISGISTYR